MKLRPRDRARSSWWAYAVHRISGVALALFLPVHFWALGQALAGPAALDHFLRWTDDPLFKLGEWGLVVLLAAHLTGGLRVLALEILPWRGWQKNFTALAAGATLLVAVLFVLDGR